MKKHITYLTIAASAIFNLNTSFAASDANLYPSNLEENVYFDSYDDATKIIKGINFDILSDGTNSTLSTNAFKIKLYLKLPTSNTPIYIHTINVAGGQHHLSSVPYQGINVDISNIQGLESGTYRLGIHVDADGQVTEANENDNIILFRNSINLTVKKPDLKIENWSFTYSNGVIHFNSINVKNIGDANASASDIRIIVEDANDPNGPTNDVDVDIASIPAGGSITVNPDDFDMNGAPTGITWRLKLVVDPLAKVSESDENNEIIASNDISKVTGLGSNVPGNIAGVSFTNSDVNVQLNATENVSISIYDLKGNLVSDVYKGILGTGAHTFQHNLSVDKSALYVCKLTSSSSNFSKKFIISE